ncbi:MAG: NAD(P)H-binding protein [Pseudomonadota bacterium]
MSNSQPHVLLAGATGYIGRAVAERLLSRGIPHSLLQRRAPSSPSTSELRETIVSTVGSELESALQGTRPSVVISCLASRSGVANDAWAIDYAANARLLKVAAGLGAEHFILLSALCVQKPKLAFQHAKLAFERELIESPIRHSIVRPTAFFRSLSGQVARVQSGKPFMVFGDGTLTACKPIGEADLADYLIDCIDRPERHERILPIGGPGAALTPIDQATILFRLLDREPKFRRVPVAVLGAAATVLGTLGHISRVARSKAELARIGRYYATESMLVWDDKQQRYDADATPSTGSRTLEDHYRYVLENGLAGHEAQEHRLFDRASAD